MCSGGRPPPNSGTSSQSSSSYALPIWRNHAIRHQSTTLGSNGTRLGSGMNEELIPIPAGAELIADFVNTNELDEPDGEKLRDPDALGAWLGAHDLLPAGATVGGDDLERALRVREALRKLLLANNGAPLDPDAVGELNRTADESRLRVSFDPRGAASLLPEEEDVP